MFPFIERAKRFSCSNLKHLTVNNQKLSSELIDFRIKVLCTIAKVRNCEALFIKYMFEVDKHFCQSFLLSILQKIGWS